MNTELTQFVAKLEEKPLNHKKHAQALALLKGAIVWAQAHPSEIKSKFLNDFQALAHKCIQEKPSFRRNPSSESAKKIMDFLIPHFLQMHAIIPQPLQYEFLKESFFSIEKITRTGEKSATTKLIQNFMKHYKVLHKKDLLPSSLNKIIKTLYINSPPSAWYSTHTKKEQKAYFKSLYYTNDFLLTKNIIYEPFEHFSIEALVKLAQSAYRGYHIILNPMMKELDELTHGVDANLELESFLLHLPYPLLKEIVKAVKGNEDYDYNISAPAEMPFMTILNNAFNLVATQTEKNNLDKTIAQPHNLPNLPGSLSKIKI